MEMKDLEMEYGASASDERIPFSSSRQRRSIKGRSQIMTVNLAEITLDRSLLSVSTAFHR